MLALASKTLEVSTRSQIVLADREKIENDLTFNGFLVTGSLLKDDAVEVVQELIQSSHYVTMITGDALLTAIHVAKVTNIIQGRVRRTVRFTRFFIPAGTVPTRSKDNGVR